MEFQNRKGLADTKGALHLLYLQAPYINFLDFHIQNLYKQLINLRGFLLMENIITEVRIFPKDNLGKTLAFANVTIMNQFVVKNLRVVKGDKGIFIGMPSNKKKTGEYVDVFFPITQEARDKITDLIVDEYNKIKAN